MNDSSHDEFKKYFTEICRMRDKHVTDHDFTANPIFHYFKKCMELRILPLPILYHMRDSKVTPPFSISVFIAKLVLKDWILTKEQWEALGYWFSTFQDDTNLVVLENNNMTDHSMSSLLHGIDQNLNPLNWIVISKNELGPQSWTSLFKLLNNRQKLTRLELNSLKIIGTSISAFLELLIEDCHLKHISMTNMKFSTKSVELLVKLLNSNYSISELNLTNMNLLPSQILSIVDAIRGNNFMKMLNLSYNNVSIKIFNPNFTFIK